jgi:hypothetical protein
MPEKSGFASEKSARMKYPSEYANFAALVRRNVGNRDEPANVEVIESFSGSAPAR